MRKWWNLNAEIKLQNFIKEGVNAHVNQIPSSDPKAIQSEYAKRKMKDKLQETSGKCPVGSLYLSGLFPT
jgi:hypothetical protein